MGQEWPDHQLAIVFDVGNVLIEWDPRYLYLRLFDGDLGAVERFLEEIHFTEWNMHQDLGRTFAEAIAEHCARYPQYCELIQAYDQRWEESLGGAIPGTVQILGSLREAGYRLYALSNWSEEKYLLVRPKYPFFAWFEDVLVSGSVGMAKPDPRIFQLLLSRNALAADKCLLIDDSPVNIRVAQSLGFNTIHFQSADRLRMDLIARSIL
jgi:2-haloacid dehalogenase